MFDFTNFLLFKKKKKYLKCIIRVLQHPQIQNTWFKADFIYKKKTGISIYLLLNTKKDARVFVYKDCFLYNMVITMTSTTNLQPRGLPPPAASCPVCVGIRGLGIRPAAAKPKTLYYKCIISSWHDLCVYLTLKKQPHLLQVFQNKRLHHTQAWLHCSKRLLACESRNIPSAVVQTAPQQTVWTFLKDLQNSGGGQMCKSSQKMMKNVGRSVLKARMRLFHIQFDWKWKDRCWNMQVYFCRPTH